ncbi:nitrogen fixation NifU-like protein [Okibacterium sp. HSC-33S16]|uniref:Fe-S cluster assembly sulfur transfer protein SufU n=1 Tax=Okibacterium sp. HSC-33S16 TaxID=2910965 RepID=UPI0020A19953|nr:SUF system NifU family Fe-S cluster assembly protein [Okibacterium sp. HSC-33S16]MCP2032545.1 nitrogen fixation NifU-like protein [Okibacterium sp. HSC-33S16]
MTSGDLAGMYQQVILEHSREKHGFGLHSEADASSHQLNPTCGDELTMQLHLDGDVVRSISWEGAGCSISMASASLLHDLVPGLTIAELHARIGLFRELMHSKGAGVDDDEPLGDAVVLEGVSKYMARVKCAMLAWVALEADLAQLAK